MSTNHAKANYIIASPVHQHCLERTVSNEIFNDVHASLMSVLLLFQSVEHPLNIYTE